MRRIADMHEGEAKADARDAAIIAEAGRSLPHALRARPKTDEALAELRTRHEGLIVSSGKKADEESNNLKRLLHNCLTCRKPICLER